MHVLGYNEKHKGCRYLHQSTGGVYLSRLVFYEHYFPFASSSQITAMTEGKLLQWTVFNNLLMFSPSHTILLQCSWTRELLYATFMKMREKIFAHEFTSSSN